MPARRDICMKKGGFVLVVAAFALPALASQPGHPLDCSDWVFLQPGYSCTVEVPLGECGNNLDCMTSETVVAGNDGYRYSTSWDYVGPCNAYADIRRVSIHRMRGSTDEVIAYIENRCN